MKTRRRYPLQCGGEHDQQEKLRKLRKGCKQETAEEKIDIVMHTKATLNLTICSHSMGRNAKSAITDSVVLTHWITQKKRAMKGIATGTVHQTL